MTKKKEVTDDSFSLDEKKEEAQEVKHKQIMGKSTCQNLKRKYNTDTGLYRGLKLACSWMDDTEINEAEYIDKLEKYKTSPVTIKTL